ncbi:class I SAM-dependent methyltransferase [Maribellus sp. YY47]|uniref:class I SAM-dependent methyltransferase n=1 Tax=Maribellus sp. YY47 TaxID=2929486 RepID=UPI0020018D26|nr:class I SAM-dependent methyltransferase [Maribellus sp. YY47]MCK3686077.1 class I SAM-dependent methyltransferase [Maribellus sp. YY47]
MNDPFGAAIKEYFEQGKAPDIAVNSNYTEDESIPVAYFFRNENEMPELEKKALQLCRGSILDVGAAAGCHALMLQNNQKDVTALEQSELAVEVMQARGIQKTITADIYRYEGAKFDTILLLMNGAGIGGTVNGLKRLLFHLKTLLNEGGQILIDSSDIKYLFEEEDGSMWIDLSNDGYYGEMEYEVSFRDHHSEFDWLFIDFKLLQKTAMQTGYSCEQMFTGEHFDYLAKLEIYK